MCGIFAAVGDQVSETALQHVLCSLEHRGPDGNGVFTDEQACVTLAHTRLAVIDLQTGAQPLSSEDGNIVLICNGELYDFERIRASLESMGHRFKTRTDSEIIIGLYERYGLGCFEHLRGEFAFILYDKVKRLLLAARDRFGIKPLYFSRPSGRFVFASEMKAIFAGGWVTPKLNAAGVDPLLEVDPRNAQFPFEGIEHVPPASYLLLQLDSRAVELASYWSPDIPGAAAAPIQGSVADAAASAAKVVREGLEEAVRLRLRADVPVGLYLSGGVDSALVGALMVRNLSTPLHSFSISFTGSERNEQKHTRQSAAFLNTAHHELAVTREMLWDNLADTVWSTEMPFATLAPIGNFLLSREARKHVKVVLNGQGADEVFLGYRSFFQDAINQTRTARASGIDTGIRLRRLKLAWLPPALIDRLSLLLFHKSQRERIAQLRVDAARPTKIDKPVINAVQEARIAEMPLDILGYLGDRVEMAHSLEVRVPFLDHRLYDASKTIPVDLKLRDGVEKSVLRDAAVGLLPEETRLRRKLGFMLTSDKIDFFGADWNLTERFRPLLDRKVFDDVRIYSWRTYRVLELLARLPLSRRLRPVRRIRANANKIIMHVLQTHMLHQMYVVERRWAHPGPGKAKAPVHEGRQHERSSSSALASMLRPSAAAASAERILYRIAGLPVAFPGLFRGYDDPLRSAFTKRYWHPQNFGELCELAAGIVLSPLILILSSTWYTLRNGTIVRRRYGRSILGQVDDQIRLYFSEGVLAPWYYIFELYKGGPRRPRSFLHRFETKLCYFSLLKSRKGSPLNDKQLFAAYCQERGLRCVPTDVLLRGEASAIRLRDRDVFVKKVIGRGGTGAERWDCVERGTFIDANHTRLSNQDLLARLVQRSRRTPLILQQRLQPHRELRNITSGALPTMRILTCLDEAAEPEVIAAMLRTSIRPSVTVDNLHAGGIGALVDIESGSLSKSSNLGANARLGWLSTHPDTGARIQGRRVPLWSEAKSLAIAAHRHFSDRVVVGWDIAVLDDGPILIEGNGNPDLDILQRFMASGFREHRLGALLAYHLERRGHCQLSIQS